MKMMSRNSSHVPSSTPPKTATMWVEAVGRGEVRKGRWQRGSVNPPSFPLLHATKYTLSSCTSRKVTGMPWLLVFINFFYVLSPRKKTMFISPNVRMDRCIGVSAFYLIDWLKHDSQPLGGSHCPFLIETILWWVRLYSWWMCVIQTAGRWGEHCRGVGSGGGATHPATSDTDKQTQGSPPGTV